MHMIVIWREVAGPVNGQKPPQQAEMAKLCILLLGLLISSGHTVGSLGVPVVTYATVMDLLQGNLSQFKASQLQDSGGKIGAFIVSDLPGFNMAMKDYLARAPDCLQKNGVMAAMLDGSSRYTFATDNRKYLPCISESVGKMASYFDVIDNFVSKILTTVTGSNESEGILIQNGNDTIKLEDAPIKEHMHAYISHQQEGLNDSPDSYMVPLHIDNGVYLIITSFADHGLEVEQSSGMTSHLNQENSVIVLMGMAATDWLLQGSVHHEKFHPVQHGVKTMVGGKITKRSVYARMKVAPADGVPVSLQGQDGTLTFNQVFQKRMFSPSKHSPQSDIKAEAANTNKRFKTWRKVLKHTCNSGEAYCWMNCLPLPTECPDVNNATCFSDATNTTCYDESMDNTCHWECRLPPSPDAENTFCNGHGTDMYMMGFKIASIDNTNTCIILFLWKLDSRWKFGLGCFGTVVMGIAIEAIIFIRRVINSKRKSFQRSLISLMLFATNTFFAYLCMLIAMTYCAELFLSVLLGLIIGHGIFNVGRLKIPWSADPCCIPSAEEMGGQCRTTDNRVSSRHLGEQDILGGSSQSHPE